MSRNYMSLRLRLCRYTENIQSFVGYEALAAAVMNVAILWDISPCSQY
jgi:hypothetical protein